MSRHKDLFQTIAQLEHDETPYAIATVFQVHGSSSGKVGDKALYSEKGKRITGYIGGGCIENRVAEVAKESLINGQPKTIEIDLDSDEMRMGIPCGGFMSIIVEPQLRNKVLFIRGFGGLAEILCQMANLLKFKVIVQTSNDEKERFPDAEKIITDEIEIGSVNLPIDFFILATHHRNDDAVSLEALRKGIPYVGVVASKKKTGIILEYLHKNGVTKKELDCFYSPVGLELNAKSPEHIALSILSEIVMLDNGGSGKPKKNGILK